MSFFEHLDELRNCIIGALICVAVGVVIAIIPLGSHPSLTSLAVDFIQRPLKKSLQNYHIEQSQRQLQAKSRELRELGYDANIADAPKDLGMTAHPYYVFPKDLEILRAAESRLEVGESTPQEERARRAKLNRVDNFSSYKDQPSARSSLLESSFSREEPTMILLWEKIADDSRVKTRSLSAQETFMIFLKTACVLGLFIASPGVFWFFWKFVGAGLYPAEKKYVYRFLPLSVTLFILGAALAFFIVFEFMLHFLFSFNVGMEIEPDTRISEWLSFAFVIPVAFGSVFQLPLLMFVLERLEIFTIEQYWEKWRIAVFILSVIAMFITPPDPWSMIFMLSSLVALYFGGIGLCKLFPMKHSFVSE